jgi:hypothetical protein
MTKAKRSSDGLLDLVDRLYSLRSMHHDGMHARTRHASSVAARTALSTTALLSLAQLARRRPRGLLALAASAYLEHHKRNRGRRLHR